MLVFSLGVVSGVALAISAAFALVVALLHSPHEPPADRAASHNLSPW
jgi:hypothetical protein